MEGGAADSFAGDFGEPALDKVQPGTAGRGEVEMIPPVGGEPLLDLGMFMGAVVVQHEVDGKPLRRLAVDFF